MLSLTLSLALLTGGVVGQFPPKPEGVRTLKSKFHPGVTISYKEPGICETTPGVKSYAGYVHLPVDALNETHEHNQYPLNTFYWFFEARKDPENAPLAIWLNGGPGGSSLLGAVIENGPCFVHNDSKSTYLNPWSWNNEVNMLYIDQPNQVGYSYDVLTNVTVDQTEYEITPADFSSGVPAQNATFLIGTSSSQRIANTANTTRHAATAIWHFAQTWFSEFPKYKPNDERISLFTESYGGRYGPEFMDFFRSQNSLISNGTLPGPGAHFLHLSTLGIINGCIDTKAMFDSTLDFARNNTYSVHAISRSQFDAGKLALHRPGGLLEDVDECRRRARLLDPTNSGEVPELNAFCANVSRALEDATEQVFVDNGGNARFDVTHEMQDPFPPSFGIGWLNQAETQAALGVPVNHTWASSAVAEAFGETGDMAKGGYLLDLARLLDEGVSVALFHGDRDYACNWLGGERYSVAVPWRGREGFNAAGYAPVVLGYPYVRSGGLTRQYGNFSFTRVYQAGHMVPSYQPEVAYEIFMRAITGRDVATGKTELGGFREKFGKEFETEGTRDAWWVKSEVLPQPEHMCYTLDVTNKCTEEEVGWLRDGTAVVEDWILVGRKTDADDEVEERPSMSFGSLNEGQQPLLKDW